MKPFIKWVGGKTQILEQVLETFPQSITNYHEIFVGGGSVLLEVLERKLVSGKVFAYDLNKSLIELYTNIQNDHEKIFNHLKILYESYEQSKEKYYYSVRDAFNKDIENTPERSAKFIFLNKIGFRGLYREGPNGFNVPYGHYKTTPKMITLEELSQVSTLIKDVEFIHCDFREAIGRVKDGDFMYLDPPYAPETKTSFVGYTKDKFGLKDHEDLFRYVKTKNVHFTMSNAKVDLVMNNFSDYNIILVKARRAINSKNPESTTTEVIVSTMKQPQLEIEVV